jgi:hypothetical protein
LTLSLPSTNYQLPKGGEDAIVIVYLRRGVWLYDVQGDPF